MRRSETRRYLNFVALNYEGVGESSRSSRDDNDNNNNKE